MAFVQGSDAKQSSDLYDKASSLKHKLESVKELATQVRDTADELKKKDKSETNKTLAKDSGELLKAVKTCLGLADNVLSLTKDGGKKSASKRSHDESDSSSPSKKKSSGDKPVVYTDGCCFMNGRHGAVGGLGVYWGPGDSRNLSEKLSGHPTNNRAEIHAARRAVEQAKEAGISDLEIRTDSMFLINSMTQWINGWKKRGWKTSAGEPVKNTEDFQALEASMAGINVEWVHVEGHSGNEGNDAADKLSKEGAKKKE